MIAEQADTSDRIKAGLGVAVLHALLGYALLTGLGVAPAANIGNSLDVFDVLPDPPPPPREKIKPLRQKAPRRAGAAAPPNLTSKATEVVAPPPVVPLVVPQPVVVAPIANVGAQTMSGAAPVVGPGTGSGGQGTGNGAGDGGDGPGGGGGGSPYRQIGGRIHDSDYPRSAVESGFQGTVYVRYIVGVNGRATGCRILRSSGSGDLDATTCRLIQDRFRFRPARDSTGRKVPTLVNNEDHTWIIARHPEVDDAEDGR